MLKVALDISSIVGVLVAVIGGALAIWRFFIFSEKASRLTFEVDLAFRVEHKDHYICEVIARIENVGNVGVTLEVSRFVLLGLRERDPIDERSEKLSFQMRFPHEIKRAEWLPKSYIEPKSQQQYSHVCAVPKEYKAVLLWGQLEYLGSDQTAQLVVPFSSGTK